MLARALTFCGRARVPSAHACAVSATAYVLSPHAARELVHVRWPVVPNASAPGGMQVRVDRACRTPAAMWPSACAESHWVNAYWWEEAKSHRPLDSQVFISDYCIINSMLFWPPHSAQAGTVVLEQLADEHAAPSEMTTASRQDALAVRQRSSSWREYIATPPWFTQCGGAGGVHAKDKTGTEMHCRAKRGAFDWYAQFCATNVSRSGACTAGAVQQLARARLANVYGGVVITSPPSEPARRWVAAQMLKAVESFAMHPRAGPNSTASARRSGRGDKIDDDAADRNVVGTTVYSGRVKHWRGISCLKLMSKVLRKLPAELNARQHLMLPTAGDGTNHAEGPAAAAYNNSAADDAHDAAAGKRLAAASPAGNLKFRVQVAMACDGAPR